MKQLSALDNLTCCLPYEFYNLSIDFGTGAA